MPHDYKVTKIELAISGSSTSDALTNSIETESSVSGVKLLNNIEKSYDKNVKLLDASNKSNKFTANQTVFRLREEPAPKKTGIGYKVFVLKKGVIGTGTLVRYLSRISGSCPYESDGITINSQRLNFLFLQACGL